MQTNSNRHPAFGLPHLLFAVCGFILALTMFLQYNLHLDLAFDPFRQEWWDYKSHDFFPYYYFCIMIILGVLQVFLEPTLLPRTMRALPGLIINGSMSIAWLLNLSKVISFWHGLIAIFLVVSILNLLDVSITNFRGNKKEAQSLTADS